jgi:hypothetical protein
MTFNQQNWTVHGDVYNTAGDLLLSRTADAAELVGALHRLRADLAALPDVDPAVRAELTAELDQTARDATEPAQRKDGIAARLRRIKDRIESLDGVTGAALGLAKTVGAVAVWVATLA